MDDSSPKRYGRGLFLATVFGGLTSLAWGRPGWSRVSGALAGVESLVPLVPRAGWRRVFGRRTWVAWGRRVWSRVSGALAGVESLVPLVPHDGWRIYSVANTMPTF